MADFAHRLAKILSSLKLLLRDSLADLRLASQSVVKHPLFRLTVIGLAIRLALAPLTQFTYDPVVWYSAGNDMLAGLSPYYTKTYSYPPLWAYTYFPFLLIASLLVDPRTFGTHIAQMDWISLNVGYSPTILSPVFLLAVKLPLIIADVSTGVLLYKLVKGFSGYGSARKTYLFWIFNPLVIWTSAVHGAFDVLPAMFTVLALALVLKGKYLATGISLSMAILYKLYPIYLIPFYAILVWTDLGKDMPLTVAFHGKVRRLGVFIAGGAIPILASIPFVSIADILHTVVLRDTYLASIGGISLWMISYAPGFGWMWGFVAGNIMLIAIITSSLALSVSALMGWTLIRKGKIELSSLSRTQVVGISAIYLTLVTVNPQYIVWILPFLTLAMYGSRLYEKRTLLLTAFALGWQLTISGPLIFLPMSYFGIPARSLIAPVQSILVSSGSLFNPFVFSFGLAGGTVLISFLVHRESLSVPLNLRILPAMHRPSAKSLNNVKRSIRAYPGYFLIAFVIGLYASSALFVQTSASSRFIPTGFDSTLSGSTLTTHGSFMIDTGSLPLQLSVVAVPVTSLEQDRPVFIYYDPLYPAVGNEPRGWIGVSDHLPAELRLRGYLGPVSIVDARGLGRVLAQNYSSTVVIPSGVFPSTVQNETSSEVASWLRGGGTLVWMGGPFGFYSESILVKDSTLLPLSSIASISSSSQEKILGYALNDPPLNGTDRIAQLNTRYSSALNLTYSDVWTAPSLALLKSVGGLAVGHLQNMTAESRSSISLIPVGLGRVILFGGPVTNVLTADGEDVIAHDAAQILSIGSSLGNGQVESSTFTLPPETSNNLAFRADFNVTTAVGGVTIVAFSDFSFSRLFWRTTTSIATIS